MMGGSGSTRTVTSSLTKYLILATGESTIDQGGESWHPDRQAFSAAAGGPSTLNLSRGVVGGQA